MVRRILGSRRAYITGLHLLASAIVVGCAAMMVFLFWYPGPLVEMCGGRNLFAVLVLVDLIVGPALTALVAGPVKQRQELTRDLVAIFVVQLAAFAYGMHSLAIARPVYLSFEFDRIQVISIVDIDPTLLSQAPAALQHLTWSGPRQIAAVRPTDPGELIQSIELGLSGVSLSQLPRQWREFQSARDDAWRVARPISQLLAHYPQAARTIVAAASGHRAEEVRFLPVQSRHASWVALIALPDSRIVGYLPLEGFF